MHLWLKPTQRLSLALEQSPTPLHGLSLSDWVPTASPAISHMLLPSPVLPSSPTCFCSLNTPCILISEPWLMIVPSTWNIPSFSSPYMFQLTTLYSFLSSQLKHSHPLKSLPFSSHKNTQKTRTSPKTGPWFVLCSYDHLYMHILSITPARLIICLVCSPGKDPCLHSAKPRDWIWSSLLKE